MALGATAGQVRAQVLHRTLGLAGAGIVTGVGVSLILNRGFTRLLYGIDASDPATCVAVALVLVVAALAAGAVPARRASRMNPTAALRLG